TIRDQSAEVWMALSGSDDHPLCHSHGTLSPRAMDRRIHPNLFPLGVGVLSARLGALSLAFRRANGNPRLAARFKTTTRPMESGSSGGTGYSALGPLSARSIPRGTRAWTSARSVRRSHPEACGHDNNRWNRAVIGNLPSPAYGSHSHHPGSDSAIQD